jgi:thiamine biosynthesis lipoprotein
MDTILSPRRRSLLLGFGALALAGCSRPGTGARYGRVAGTTMGSAWTARFATRGTTAAGVQAAVQGALDAVDERMSMFRPRSELSVFNAAPAGVPVSMSGELYGVLAAASEVSRWSGGAFDVTVAPLVEQWGFGTRSGHTVPTSTSIASERARIGWQGLEFDGDRGSVTKLHEGVHADLGGIAKGYGVDRAAAALDALGIASYMIEVGGEVRARGVNAEGRPWRIGVEEPDAMPQRARWVVPLDGHSMATSGDYRNYFVEGGRRYSHEIDPASGAPIRHGLCSVTVVADTCMKADALATALIVLGATRGRALAESSHLAAQFIERLPDGSFRDSMTPAFGALKPERA